nr:MAG TPA: hypothetical protein [Caudoviricetes sp.]
MGHFVEKASHHAGCFEFVDVNKIGRKRIMTGFVIKERIWIHVQ